MLEYLIWCLMDPRNSVLKIEELRTTKNPVLFVTAIYAKDFSTNFCAYDSQYSSITERDSSEEKLKSFKAYQTSSAMQ